MGQMIRELGTDMRCAQLRGSGLLSFLEDSLWFRLTGCGLWLRRAGPASSLWLRDDWSRLDWAGALRRSRSQPGRVFDGRLNRRITAQRRPFC